MTTNKDNFCKTTSLSSGIVCVVTQCKPHVEVNVFPSGQRAETEAREFCSDVNDFVEQTHPHDSFCEVACIDKENGEDDWAVVVGVSPGYWLNAFRDEEDAHRYCVALNKAVAQHKI